MESALDKGLDVENSDFAEQMLSQVLLERASQLTAVIRAVPADRLIDPQLQRVQALAVSDLRRVLTYDNPPLEATAMLAQLLSLPGGNRREARQLLNQLIKQEAFAALPADERAESLILRATLQKSPDKALADYGAAIDLAPDNPEYRLARANFHREQHDADKALVDVRAVIEKNPDNVTAYLLEADILRDADKLDDALASVEKARKLAPDEPGILQTRGELYRLKEDYDKAIDQFTQVLKLEPGLALALIHRAEAYYAAEKLDEALADLETLIKDHPGLAVAHGLRAQVLAGKKRLPEAIAEMEKLAKDLPEQTDYRMQLGLYYLLNDQPRAAIAAYGEVLSLDAKNFLALRSRGDAYLNIGDHAAAVADFAKALELKSDDSALLNNYAWVLATSPDDKVRDGKRAPRVGDQSLRSDQVRAGAHPQHAGRGLRRDGRLCQSARVVRKGRRHEPARRRSRHQGGIGEGTVQLPTGQAVARTADARRPPAERGRSLGAQAAEPFAIGRGPAAPVISRLT